MVLPPLFVDASCSNDTFVGASWIQPGGLTLAGPRGGSCALAGRTGSGGPVWGLPVEGPVWGDPRGVPTPGSPPASV